MVLTYAYDDDSKSKSDSDSDYEPEDDDHNVLGSKELTGGTSIYYAWPEAKIFFLKDWDKLHMRVLWSK